jgi:malic enzyme
VPRPVPPPTVIGDDEIFEAHAGGKLMVAAAEAIFSVVSDDLAIDRIVPSPLDLRVGEAVAKAVALATEASDTPV